MARRSNHYEAAFEAYLRARGVPYVAVDETRRSLVAGDKSLKSVDFIVSPTAARSWLVDVKGRRFPSGDQPHYWKNWSTLDDLRSLARWEELFGEQFGGLFVFAYNVVGKRAPLVPEQLFAHRGAIYAFLGVRLSDYAQRARMISPRWETVALPAGTFRSLAVPFEDLLVPERATACSA